MKRNIISLNPNINTSIHLFDHAIKPILLYGSEIWACSLPKKTSIDDLFDFNKIARSFYSEKLHIHFCKYILGVHKRSSNFAVFSEFGRYPLQISILLSTLSYWHRLKTQILSFCQMHLHAPKHYMKMVFILGFLHYAVFSVCLIFLMLIMS